LRTLGAFAIERDGEPFRVGRKAPKRLLDLLRVIIALGGRQVDGGRVAALLWPEAQGDEAHDSLKVTLHRVRALLGPDVLMVRDGQLSFDAGVVWLDTWAFEHVSARIEALLAPGRPADSADEGELEHRRCQLLTLYRGHFLGEADVPRWGLPLRDRLRVRFVRTIEAMGPWLERRGRHATAIAMYQAALEQDNLAEELYQRLIECHLACGEVARALNAYRRCRELLSIVLGVKPSARTEALVARIAQG
jgi:DNA-binding SARP family transcriptional activator